MTPRLTPERVRELLDDIAGACGDSDCRMHPCGACCLAIDARGILRAAAPDLATDVLALHDALARVTRERDEARELALDAARVASRSTADRDAAVLERDVAVAARDALVGAVREYGDALAAEETARHAWNVGCSAEEDDEADSFRGPLTTAYDAAMRRRAAALTALLDGAPTDVVQGDVVRAYLAAADALPGDLATINAAIDKERAARAALDAALLAAKGAP